MLESGQSIYGEREPITGFGGGAPSGVHGTLVALVGGQGAEAFLKLS